MKPVIKWHGGKSKEIPIIEPYLPREYDRYIEPFAGGAALFFHLEPTHGIINDKCDKLITFYLDLQAYPIAVASAVTKYDKCWRYLYNLCRIYAPEIREKWKLASTEEELSVISATWSYKLTTDLRRDLPEAISIIWLRHELYDCVTDSLWDKMKRLKHNYANPTRPYTDQDIDNNITTGVMAGLYYYFRKRYNFYFNRAQDIRTFDMSAIFFWIHEYAYGAMMRYNRLGDFNVPYGGISYNSKTLERKLDYIKSDTLQRLLQHSYIGCLDFELLFNTIAPRTGDFIFLDPPYDSEFSTYDGIEFGEAEQRRLADCCKRLPSKVMLVVKKTPLIEELYSNDFTIREFPKTYACNIRNRNDRDTTHLIITNY